MCQNRPIAVKEDWCSGAFTEAAAAPKTVCTIWCQPGAFAAEGNRMGHSPA